MLQRFVHHILSFDQYVVVAVSPPPPFPPSPQVSLSLRNPSLVGASVSVAVPPWVVALGSLGAIALALIAIGVTFAILGAVSYL